MHVEADPDTERHEQLTCLHAPEASRMVVFARPDRARERERKRERGDPFTVQRESVRERVRERE